MTDVIKLSKTPGPPAYLRLATRRWWLEVVTDWQLEAHHIRLLTLACESWDRGQDARELLKAEGLTTTSRLGERRAHPAVAIERDSRLAFARILRELDLDLTAPAETVRSPRLRSMTGGRRDAS
jgi:P27 family predicted phage terminase small subunit